MAFILPRLTRCCCCLSLRTGSLIIGYVSLMTTSLFMATFSWSLYTVVKFVKINANKLHPEHKPEEVAQVALGLYITHAYALLVLLYHFMISLLLVIGVHMNKTKYLRYYFTAGLFLLALAIALVVVSTIFFGLLSTIPALKWCLILFYCLIVVRSTYLEMEEQNKPRVYEMQTLNSPQQVPLIA
ncbi:unnamed protein product [Parnassius apollo]|uniref:(apollo) hypothetical protein n=1 Tax=Parnassius apollo TaxID=110799 RepID=A0A8S3XVY7_PARAO|nr:unnamed protein product [Parnassius apollo]